MNLFNAPEIVDIAIEKEKKRRDFYARSASEFNDKKIKGLFTKLKEWEDAHIKKFQEIRDGIKEKEATDKYPGELKDYAEGLLDESLYGDVSATEFSRHIKTPLAAIQYGIMFEKDAILFFNEFLPGVLPKDKPMIQTLIDEEKQHIAYLAKLRSAL